MEPSVVLPQDFYFDPNCECDAPTYVDFTDLAGQYDDNADEWFDKRTEEKANPLLVESEYSSEDDVKKSSEEVKDGSEEVKESSPKLGTMQVAANALVQMIASGTESISKLKSRILPPKPASTKPNSSMTSSRLQKKVTEDCKRSNPTKDEPQARIPMAEFVAKFHKTTPPRFRRNPMGVGMSKQSEKAERNKRPKSCHMTIPKSPNLHTKSRVRAATSTSHSHVPTAEFVAKFHTTTPPRFRGNPRVVEPADKPKQPEKDGGGQKGQMSSHLTIPKSPALHTKGRARPVTAKGMKELEEQELAEMKENQFKANTLDKKIFEKSGMYGVPRRKDYHPVTEAHTPNFPSKSLPKRHKAASETDGEQACFQAKPMPDFSKITGVPQKRPHPLTEPESPAIVKRPRVAGSSQWAKPDSTIMEARPAPKLDKNFKVMYPDRQPIVPQPFSFEERDKNKPGKHEEAGPSTAGNFVARPAPKFDKGFKLKYSDKPPVIPQPFSFEERDKDKQTKFEREMEEKRQQEKEQTEFKAKKKVSSILYGKPFVPEKRRKPLVRVDNFVLHTDLRSQKRHKYDSQRRHRSYLLEMENLQRRALREAEDAKEIVEYRKTLVHKPLPIAPPAPVVIKSVAMPTVPISPKFETDRLRNRR